MSNSRQHAPPSGARVRSYSITHPPGVVALPTQPGWDQLVLAEGDSVTQVALAVGYSTPSAFVAAFRSELDVPPREFMRTRTSLSQRS